MHVDKWGVDRRLSIQWARLCTALASFLHVVDSKAYKCKQKALPKNDENNEDAKTPQTSMIADRQLQPMQSSSAYPACRCVHVR